MAKNENTNKKQNKQPDPETLRHQLQIQWQDFFNGRADIWNTLKIEAALVLSMVGADLIKFDNFAIILILGIILAISCCSAIKIAIQHRTSQRQKFVYIRRLEKKLGLHEKIINDVNLPSEFRWKDVYDYEITNTPLFIIRMNIAILMFTIIYIVTRVPWYVSTTIGAVIIVWITLPARVDINDDLISAAKEGYTATVKNLLDKSADVNAKDKNGWTALIWVAIKGHTAILQALLDKGAEVNAKTSSGETALMVAAEYGHTETLTLLLEQGAEMPNAKDEDGKTALMVAAEYGHTDIIEFLKQHGATE